MSTTKPPTPIRTGAPDGTIPDGIDLDEPLIKTEWIQAAANADHQPPKVIVPSVTVTVGASQNRGAALIASGSAMLTVALVYQAHEGFHMLMVLLSLVSILALVCGLPSMNDDDTSVGTRP
jgi:hypothetical protein